MGNVIESLASGFINAIGSLFRAPLDFLSGKSCSSVCGTTWDLICYVEHFCVANLLKLGLIILVLYIALFFLYLTYKLRIFHCICHTLCKATTTYFAICFHIWGKILYCMCHKLFRPTRRQHRRMYDKHETTSENDKRNNKMREESSCDSNVGRRMAGRRWREHQRSHLRRSLRPMSHRVQVEISDLGRRHSRKHRRKYHLNSNVNHVRVTRTSKFANKSKNFSTRTAIYRGKG